MEHKIKPRIYQSYSLSPLSTECKRQVSERLKERSLMFSYIWDAIPSYLDSSYPTGVYFSDPRPFYQKLIRKEATAPLFIWNSWDWKIRSNIKKDFVIAHECVHLIANHGIFHPVDYRLNGALDIIINEFLSKNFGFDRSVIDPHDLFMWADKLGDDVPSDETWDFYDRVLEGGSEEIIPGCDKTSPQINYELIRYLDQIIPASEKRRFRPFLEKHCVHSDDDDKELWTFQ